MLKSNEIEIFFQEDIDEKGNEVYYFFIEKGTGELALIITEKEYNREEK